MKKIVVPVLLLVVLIIFTFFFYSDISRLIFSEIEKNNTIIIDDKKDTTSEPVEDVTIIARDLEIPWDIAFLPQGGMLVTERTGHVIEIDKDAVQHEIPVEGVKRGGEGGLLGIVLHPDFAQNHLLYLYMSTPGTGSQTQNQVVRYRYENNALNKDKIIIDKIPGAIYHDGGRMEFGPDQLLYITTGDATTSHIAQDINSLGGKILRVNDDGSIPKDNPFGTAVYSYGHRNPQGITWDEQGRLWSTEHGRSGALSGYDEVNLIHAGANYGWPVAQGEKEVAGMISPVLQSGASTTWAPASLVYLNGRLFFGGLLGESLYEAILDNDKISQLKTHFKGEFGRIRTVRLGEDNMLYLTTSNRDGRGDASAGDDKIIRVNPKIFFEN